MRLPSLTLPLLISLTVGCQTLPGKKIDRLIYGEQPQGTFTQPGFEDIELPRGLTYENKSSTILNSAEQTYGEIHFKGRLQGLAVADFFDRHMVQNGWHQLSRVHLDHHFLIFEKQDRLCMATVKEGSINTQVVLLVVPRSLTTAATTPPGPTIAEEQPEEPVDVVPLFPEDETWR